ncbi:MAG: hypothetical protein ABI675_14345 [Chitinophagaceae bacterium]
MASEKFRYFPKADPEREKVLQKIETRYQEIIQQLSAEELRTIMREISTGHSHVSKEVICRCMPLSKKEMEVMLHSVIDAEADGDDIISADAEMAVEKITAALMENAAELIQKGETIQAAMIGSVIITVIESRMERVYDEGWTFQCIVKDAFELLKRISEQSYSADIAGKLIATCFQVFESRDEDIKYYDDEWQEVMNALKNNAGLTKTDQHSDYVNRVK